MLKALGLGLIVSALHIVPALAEGPGSQIRSGPGVVAAPTQPQPQRADTPRCEALPGADMERCLREARDKKPSPRREGPESTGMGSGAGASSAAGHGSPGGTAPR